jgi:sugar lactone lactonase YvrE
MNIGLLRAGILPSLALTATVLVGDLSAQLNPSLWVSDDVNKRIYNVTLDGAELSSFHSGSISGVSLGIGARTETIWAAKEGSNLIVHFDDKGNTVSSFPGTKYDRDGVSPEGVAMDAFDGSLWIVDDVTLRIYNVEPDGTLISEFSTSAFASAAKSPQDIATDPSDGTLWLTDNGSDRVYNVTRAGDLVSSFHVSSFQPAAKNLQGICVDPIDRTLWVTERDTHAIYNLSRAGTLIAVLDLTAIGVLNPTGVAFDAPKQPTLPGLLVDIAKGIDVGQIEPGPAERIGQLVKLAMNVQKKGYGHVAAKHLLVFHVTVGMLSGGLIHETLAVKLQANSAVLIEQILKG